ncbi:TetR family transcriptional regulator [Paenibacillus sp. J31TS4]|uniref:TetR/AcrR family transcriptional regulator n=1 Tax=Paenibacillus sp. J31TS4 TaxID=2807195 RepID=UPI001B294D7E|nr:TetR/AcrR family transcriptional regulator [Paenibacillus sp. J31TS4]GIP40151.1 TetR family transcriptional regulator [Paenibacillus sp. J31TS4]
MSIDRRQLIVEAAAKSFALFGYKATTMEQIAKLANVGKGTIYTFFTNKEELFQEVLDRLIREMKQVAEETFDPDRRFFDNLYLVLDRLLDYRERHELVLKLSQEVRETNVQMALGAIRRIEQEIVGYTRMQVQRAMDKGEIKPCDPEITSFVILKLFLALTADWTKFHEPLGKERIAELLRMYLQEGLAPVQPEAFFYSMD